MTRKLKLIRTCDYYGRIRSLSLFIDNEKAGAIRAGETLELDLPYDAQVLRGKMDWAHTEPQTISDLGDGAVVEIRGQLSANPLRWVGIPTMPFLFTVLDRGATSRH